MCDEVMTSEAVVESMTMRGASMVPVRSTREHKKPIHATMLKTLLSNTDQYRFLPQEATRIETMGGQV